MDNEPRFNKVIQVSTLISVLTLAIPVCSGLFFVYQSFQDQFHTIKDQLQELKMNDALQSQRIDALSVDVKVIKEDMKQLKAEQKETDNALRKSLDSISNDLLKVRVSLGGRGRSDLMREQGIRGWADTGTRPIPSPVSPDAQRHEGLE